MEKIIFFQNNFYLRSDQKINLLTPKLKVMKKQKIKKKLLIKKEILVDLSKIKGGIAPPEESAFMGVCETQHGSRCVLYTLPPGGC
ncbi:hypothetical protein AS358_16295 [Elizabethkingia anophelis]|nr:hypothetical protein AS358_16295 [Elizabethkingia anophelis]CAH1143300.1 hypothetical protein EAVNVH72_00314 [Elizabethkingia anophelis]CAI9683804.1 hypothetical protein EAVNVH72_02481 [Elizabethkingia anophelis]